MLYPILLLLLVQILPSLYFQPLSTIAINTIYYDCISYRNALILDVTYVTASKYILSDFDYCYSLSSSIIILIRMSPKCYASLTSIKLINYLIGISSFFFKCIEFLFLKQSHTVYDIRHYL